MIDTQAIFIAPIAQQADANKLFATLGCEVVDPFSIPVSTSKDGKATHVFASVPFNKGPFRDAWAALLDPKTESRNLADAALLASFQTYFGPGHAADYVLETNITRRGYTRV